MISILMVSALCLDELLGEVKKYHPVIMFGNYANWIEQLTYQKKFISGILAWCLCVAPIVITFITIEYLLFEYSNIVIKSVFEIIVLYFTVGQKSLKQHAKAVADPLSGCGIQKPDIHAARTAVSMIVSRDTQTLTEQQLATATIETVTENTHDAIIGPLVFFAIFGAPGAIIFRLCNTLDAMWGYHSDKYEKFGKFSARADDVLGYIPARITVLLMLVANPFRFKQTIKNIWTTGRRWYSPNAGIVMAAGAGALDVKLGGDAVYQGRHKTRLSLGYGNPPGVNHINQSIRLMYSCSLIFVSSMALAEYLL
jgi:adenosylcobinamide-phosphate synthase